MARFLGRVSGRAKTSATRLGSPSSGIETDCNGWNVGVTVYGSAIGDKDQFEIYATGGSNGGMRKLIATVVETDSGFSILHPNPTSS